MIPGIEAPVWCGGGRSSDVLCGWEPATRRRVAIKVFAGTVGANAVTHETAAHARVGACDGVVGLHRVVRVSVDGAVRPGLQMDACDQRSLGRMVVENGPLDGSHVRRWGVQLAAALAAMHEVGVAHRDLTADHVLFHGDSVRLCDFGAASVDDAVPNEAIRRALTPAYAAPERLSDPRALGGAEADIWSLGAVLCTALLGRPPFGTPSEGGWEAFRRRRGHAPLARWGDPAGHERADRTLIEVLRWAMADDPGARPSAIELARLLCDSAGSATFPSDGRQRPSVTTETGPLLDRRVWFP